METILHIFAINHITGLLVMAAIDKEYEHLEWAKRGGPLGYVLMIHLWFVMLYRHINSK
jgi:di/tricarboxylate transporter